MKLLTVSLWTIVAIAVVIIISLKVVVLDNSKSLGGTFSLGTAKISTKSTDPNELSLDSMIMNIRADDYKILKADFGIKLTTKNGHKVLKENMQHVRSTILQHITSMDANQIHTERGKEILKRDLIELLEAKFGFEIESLYFRNFILVPQDNAGI